jgi:hypothetical protein
MTYMFDFSTVKDFLIACAETSKEPEYLDTSGYDHSHQRWISEYENDSGSTRYTWTRMPIRAAINQASIMGFIYEFRLDDDDTVPARPVWPVTKAELEKRRSEGIKHIYTTDFQPLELGDWDMPCTLGYVPESVRKKNIPRVQDLSTDTFSGRLINPSRVDYSLLRAWISQCRRTCELDKFVRDQKRFSQIQFCLIDTFTRELIEVGAKRQVKYVALSYVWGGASIEPQIDDWETPPVLPRKCATVIEDALKVVKELGFRYLWVDNYCISKDSSQRHNQIANMDLVYKNAEVTIIAAAGNDATYGLPGIGSRSRHKQQQVTVQGQKYIMCQASIGSKSHTSSYPERGWTYQEFFFSRRRLIFSDSQVSFECQHRCHPLRQQECMSCPPQALIAGELKGVQRYSDHDATDLYLRSVSDFHIRSVSRFQIACEPGHSWSPAKAAALNIFEYHVRQYTKRRLSFDDDALQAVESILNRFANGGSNVYHIQGLPYHALWWSTEESIRLGLLWTHGSTKTPLRRRLNFPSWSWTGWEGEVGWLTFGDNGNLPPPAVARDLPTKDLSIKVERVGSGNVHELVNVRSWRFFEYGHVHPTVLHISGWALLLSFRASKHDDADSPAIYLDARNCSDRLDVTHVAPTEELFDGKLFYGIALRWSHPQQKHRSPVAYVLVLQPTTTGHMSKVGMKYYERIGVMGIPGHSPVWREFPKVDLEGCLI